MKRSSAYILILFATIVLLGTIGRPFDTGAATQRSQAGAYTAYLPLVPNGSFGPAGTLTNGGSVRVSTGAVIGAVGATLAAPVDVILAETSAPAVVPGGVTPVGSYYTVGALDTVLAPAEKPFLIGLPVPPGVDPGTLSVLVRTEPGRALDASDGAAAWVPAAGSYDSTNNLLVTTITRLSPTYLTIVLAQSPAVLSGTPTAASLHPAQSGPEFVVGCWNALTNPACNLPNQALIAEELRLAYADLVTGLGFRAPALTHLVGRFNGPTLEPDLTLASHYLNIFINTAQCHDEEGDDYGGRYHPDLQAIEYCLHDAGNDPAAVRRLVRHELFHAIQYAYPAMARDSRKEQYDWVGEGTAAAAEESSATLARSPDFEHRQISVSLTDESDDNEYRTQDFWVYTGRSLGESLAYLQPIFEQGGTPEHVNNALTLDSAYWNWIKNQLIEKQIPLDGPVLASTCQMEFGLIGPSIVTRFPETRSVQGTLAPLTSILVEVTFDHPMAVAAFMADNDGDSNDLRYKVYVEGEAGCEAVPDGQRVFRPVPQFAERFVLVSNVSIDTPFTFVVQIIGD